MTPLDNVSLSVRAHSEGSGGRRLLNEFLTWIGGSRTWTWPFAICFLPVNECLCQLGIRIPRTGSNERDHILPSSTDCTGVQ